MRQVKKVDHWAILASVCLAAALGAVRRSAGAETAPDPAAAHYFAGELVDKARGYLRDVTIAPAAAAASAAILLQHATALDGADVKSLKMLADAAHVAGKPAVEKDALRKLIGLDNGDFVAQVQYLDLLAGSTEVLDERARIYQSAYDQATLDPQIRSQMALRLAQIAEERGQADREAEFLNRAVQLNNVNVEALRRLARLAAQHPEDPKSVKNHLTALTALLTADPYQPDAWMALARICEATNLHDKAAEALSTAFEQSQLQGIMPTGELYLELAIEQAAAGHRVEAFQLAGPLAKSSDSPLAVLIVGEILAAADVPGVDPPTATQPQKVVLAEKIHTALAEMVKAATGKGERVEAAALADAAGTELTVLPEVSADAAGWIDAYARWVAADDVTLARLRGWQAYRASKPADAKAIFAKAGEGDPLVQLGKARLFIDDKKIPEATALLQDIWSSHPQGLLALQVVETARRGGIQLADTQWTKEMRDILGRMPTTLSEAHAHPIEYQLITVNVRKPEVGIGEPIPLTVRMSNATERPLPAGPDGVAVTTLGVAAAIHAPVNVPVGAYIIDDVQRVYRVEPHGMIETTIRLDQGQLADYFAANPSATFSVSLMAATAPRVAPNGEMSPGLGGQAIPIGDIQRGGMPTGAGAMEKLRQEVVTPGGQKQLVRIEAAGAFVAASLKNKPGAPDAATAKSLQDALTPLAKSGDPLVRAGLVRSLPAMRVGDDLEKSVADLSGDRDALVRILWAAREGAIARTPGEAGKAAASALEARSKDENDPQVKEWLGLMLDMSKPAAARTSK